jgi:hypothetical protein
MYLALGAFILGGGLIIATNTLANTEKKEY